MSEDIKRLKRVIGYAFVSGDPARDLLWCSKAVIANEATLHRTMATKELTAREIAKLTSVLCTAHITGDEEFTWSSTLARRVLLLALVRTSEAWTYPIQDELAQWMQNHETDSVLRLHLKTHLLNMPHRYQVGMLEVAVQNAHSHL